jgi:hypothetical protein
MSTPLAKGSRLPRPPPLDTDQPFKVKARAVSATVVARPVAVASFSKALRKRRSHHLGDSARFVMTNSRGDRNVPIAEEYSRYRGVPSLRDARALSAFLGVVVLLLAATLLALLALPALLDGVAALARPKPGLAGISIGIVGNLRLVSHFDLRW